MCLQEQILRPGQDWQPALLCNRKDWSHHISSVFVDQLKSCLFDKILLDKSPCGREKMGDRENCMIWWSSKYASSARTDCCRRQLQRTCLHECASWEVDVLYTPPGQYMQRRVRKPPCFVHWFVASSEQICSFLSMRRPMQCVCCCFCRPTAEASKHQAVKQEVTSEWQKRPIDMKFTCHIDIKSKQRNRIACESERWLTLHISEIGLGVPDGPGSFNETDLDTRGLWRSDKAEDRCLGRTYLGMFEAETTQQLQSIAINIHWTDMFISWSLSIVALREVQVRRSRLSLFVARSLNILQISAWLFGNIHF